MKTDLCWNVYSEDFNAREIKSYNIFNHYGFLTDLMRIRKELDKQVSAYIKANKDVCLGDKQIIARMKEDYKKDLKITYFIPEVDRALKYYFWGKAEHEVVITSWPPYITRKEFERINADEFKESKYAIYVEPEVFYKVDIYSQVKLNFDIFVEYLWLNYEKIPKRF